MRAATAPAGGELVHPQRVPADRGWPSGARCQRPAPLALGVAGMLASDIEPHGGPGRRVPAKRISPPSS